MLLNLLYQDVEAIFFRNASVGRSYKPPDQDPNIRATGLGSDSTEKPDSDPILRRNRAGIRFYGKPDLDPILRKTGPGPGIVVCRMDSPAPAPNAGRLWFFWFLSNWHFTCLTFGSSSRGNFRLPPSSLDITKSIFLTIEIRFKAFFL